MCMRKCCGVRCAHRSYPEEAFPWLGQRAPDASVTGTSPSHTSRVVAVRAVYRNAFANCSGASARVIGFGDVPPASSCDRSVCPLSAHLVRYYTPPNRTSIAENIFPPQLAMAHRLRPDASAADAAQEDAPMKPLFTIHEGEFLVGDHINRRLG